MPLVTFRPYALHSSMSIKVNLRHLAAHDLHLKDELPVAELDFGLADEIIQARKPLHYDLRIEAIDNGILVQGRLSLTLDCECVRCLKSFEKTVELPNWTLHLPLEGDEKVAVDNDSVDLTPFVREDMLLQFPQHPLCRPDCAGLKKKARDQAKSGPSAWKELDKLSL
jgi:uncharacterized metal-binding protein YceD (DUF177 family)